MMRSSRDNSSASSTQGQINGVVTLGEIKARESSGFKDWKSNVFGKEFFFFFCSHLALPAYKCSLSHVRLCNPMDCSPPGSSVHGILQAGILEWVAIYYSRRSSNSRRVWTHISWTSCFGRQGLYCLHHLGSPTWDYFKFSAWDFSEHSINLGYEPFFK